MFTPTPDFLCDFKFEPGFDVAGKLRAFKKNVTVRGTKTRSFHKFAGL